MENEARIAQVKALARDNKQAITYILSACIDYGSNEGGFISGKNFDKVAELIMAYFEIPEE